LIHHSKSAKVPLWNEIQKNHPNICSHILSPKKDADCSTSTVAIVITLSSVVYCYQRDKKERIHVASFIRRPWTVNVRRKKEQTKKNCVLQLTTQRFVKYLRVSGIEEMMKYMNNRTINHLIFLRAFGRECGVSVFPSTSASTTFGSPGFLSSVSSQPVAWK
jgi:hypothetical protein